MNQYDVSGILSTYSMKCRNARSSDKLKEIIRELKVELNANEIKKMNVEIMGE